MAREHGGDAAEDSDLDLVALVDGQWPIQHMIEAYFESHGIPVETRIIRRGFSRFFCE